MVPSFHSCALWMHLPYSVLPCLLVIHYFLFVQRQQADEEVHHGTSNCEPHIYIHLQVFIHDCDMTLFCFAENLWQSLALLKLGQLEKMVGDSPFLHKVIKIMWYSKQCLVLILLNVCITVHSTSCYINIYLRLYYCLLSFILNITDVFDLFLPPRMSTLTPHFTL